MKLAASLIVRDEASRYLRRTLASLTSFCDLVLVMDDGSKDETPRVLEGFPRTAVWTTGHSIWRAEGEGVARDELLRWTLRECARNGVDWCLSIDADEMVADGPALRRALVDARPPDAEVALALRVVEVWDRDERKTRSGPLPFFNDYDTLPRPCDMPYWRHPGTWWIRMDGGWAPRQCPVLWRPPQQTMTEADRFRQGWTIPDSALACGREPEVVRLYDTLPSSIDLCHLGWSDPAERQGRYDRYMALDGGRFHDSAHLRSILEPPMLASYPKPPEWSRSEAAS